MILVFRRNREFSRAPQKNKDSQILRFSLKGVVNKQYARTRIDELVEQPPPPEIDSKYRLIILAAKRSKQLQRGARPRIEIDPLKHKFTRIALEEVIQGRVRFHTTTDGKEAPAEER